MRSTRSSSKKCPDAIIPVSIIEDDCEEIDAMNSLLTNMTTPLCYVDKVFLLQAARQVTLAMGLAMGLALERV
uniref:Uncharacterized protein n=1 Tax=Parascaris equorum TaxID=6256 RepID=A0A914S4X2_PAREQ